MLGRLARSFNWRASLGLLPLRRNSAAIEAVINYGYFLGLAFQAKDDILDVTSSAEKLGKPTQADSAALKLTYPALLDGVAAAQAEADRLSDRAISEIRSVFQSGGEILEELARYAVSRDK